MLRPLLFAVVVIGAAIWLGGLLESAEPTGPWNCIVADRWLCWRTS